MAQYYKNTSLIVFSFGTFYTFESIREEQSNDTNSFIKMFIPFARNSPFRIYPKEIIDTNF